MAADHSTLHSEASRTHCSDSARSDGGPEPRSRRRPDLKTISGGRFCDAQLYSPSVVASIPQTRTVVHRPPQPRHAEAGINQGTRRLLQIRLDTEKNGGPSTGRPANRP